MEFINRIELCGVVGRTNTTAVGHTTVCNFSLVTENPYQGNDGGIIIDTMWFSVYASGLPGLEAVQKGSHVHVAGRLRSRRFADAEGNERVLYEVVAQTLKLVDE